MKIKTRLTIEAIIRWEQMTGRSFLHIDFSDERDMRRLMYCATVVCSPEPFTFEAFEKTLENERIATAAIRSISSYNAFVAQFSRKGALEGSVAATSAADNNITVGAIASKLIVSAGIDARFVMREMLVEDMPMYIEALNDKLRHEEESRRLWTFYTILPHVNGKKIKTPQKIHIFPWEAEEAERRAREEMVRNEADFRRFMSGELIDINAIQWRKKTYHEQ